MIKRELNKWQVVFDIHRRIEYRNYGWRSMWIGAIRINKFPTEGEVLSSKHYSGFLLRFMYWLPVDKDY